MVILAAQPGILQERFKHFEEDWKFRTIGHILRDFLPNAEYLLICHAFMVFLATWGLTMTVHCTVLNTNMMICGL